METVVYADLFFMINFSMDFLCLFLTAKLLGVRASLLREVAASVFGGAYACAALFFPFGGVTCFILDALSCAVLCLIAFFKPREWRRAPLYVLVYTAVSMVLGGSMTALFNLFNKTRIFDFLKGSDGDGLSVWLFALLALISGVITLLGGRFFSSRMARKRLWVSFTYGGRSVRVLAITDNGNLLREPISGKPCIVADISELRSILPEEMIEAAQSSDLLCLDRVPVKDRGRVLLIPTSTATGSGVLVGVRMEKIEVESKSGAVSVDAVVALSDISRGADGVKALLPSSIAI